jgi:hypothetical protein
MTVGETDAHPRETELITRFTHDDPSARADLLARPIRP